MERNRWASWWPDLLFQAVAAGAIYLLIRKGFQELQALQGGEDREQAEQKQAAAAVLRRLDRTAVDGEDGEDGGPHYREGERPRRPKKEHIALDRYEQMIAMDVIAPEDIPLSFSDIGGLGDIIEELKESVIYPLTMPELYSHTSSLLAAPSGVLLYGPPGCGKTMLAKAVAHESGATFINLHIASVTEKWFGDSNKLVTAVFTLARKLQPSIIFIDEIDAVLSKRKSFEHEASSQVKAEFMTHWDGLTSTDLEGKPQGVMILGATNRFEEIDEAILRRMPKKFPIPLPSASQRLRIFGLILKGTKLEKNDFDLEYLVRVSAGMSGSDIKEACRDAAMMPMRELLRQKRASGCPVGRVNPEDVRGLRTRDFFEAAGGIQLQQPQHYPQANEAPSSAGVGNASTDEQDGLYG